VENDNGAQGKVDGINSEIKSESPDVSVAAETGDDETSLHTVSSSKESTKKKRRSAKATTIS